MTYFVTEQFIKTKTHITQNVDAKDLAPYVPLSVKTYVQPILGYNFTNDLLTKFNEGTTSEIEDELIEFIQYVTAFYSAYDAVPNLSLRVSNKGIQSQSGDYSASESIAGIEYVRNNILKFAKVHEGNMRAWLDLNKNSFPLYLSNLNKEVSAPDNQRNFRTDTTWL
jgi:sulfur relay (sulfurtransferase) DsrC/TusE family protein